jgi:hypothetical protein
MERFALFIDAGYLYAAGGELCCGTKRRDQVEVNFQTFTESLVDLGVKYTPGEQHLRTYWYDGAPDGVPTPSQLAVAYQKGVKLRLGRLTLNGQKGVDSLVVRDLMKLSSEHAITTAFLLSGDEDLRQGVVEAQDSGVKVVLIGIQPFGSQNQAGSLVREADDVIVLDQAALERHLKRRPDRAVAFMPPAEGSPAGQPQEPGGATTALATGSSFGAEWLAAATPEEVATLAARKTADPRAPVPQELDRELLGRGRRLFGDDISEDQRKGLRDGFWTAIRDSGRPTES